jgi:hypothetical protein
MGRVEDLEGMLDEVIADMRASYASEAALLRTDDQRWFTRSVCWSSFLRPFLE